MNEMKTWSEWPVNERFRIKIYLDTNILCYLVDDTYQNLTFMINYFKDSVFSDLVSSKYVIFEFTGVRKKEHYLQILLKKTMRDGKKVNISSLLKYKDTFDNDYIAYNDIKGEVNDLVKKELEKITTDFGIEYSFNVFHDDLMSPTIEINLNSKISKEDSLVLTSAIWSDKEIKEDFVLIASNDQDFVNNFNTDKQDILNVFESYSLNLPVLENLTKISLKSGTVINFVKEAFNEVRIHEFVINKHKELLIHKNISCFLGYTINCGKNFPSDVICFSLEENIPLNSGIYLVFIGENLDFIYSTKIPITSFWDQVEIEIYPFVSNFKKNISFRILDIGLNGKPIDPEILEELKKPNNLIFINQDGEI